MDDVVKYLIEGRGIWNHRPNTEVLINFNQEIISPIAKIWKQFLCTRITPALNVSNVNTFWAILLYGILQKNKYVLWDGSIAAWSDVLVARRSEFFPPPRDVSMRKG